MSAKESGLNESTVGVKRVTKVIKGGRKFSFAACVVVGDKAGSVGYGHGKANEVADAKTKALQEAKKRLCRVPIYQGRTIHHDVIGRSGAALVLLRRAKPGTGIIAGGSMRAVLDLLGIHDVVAKSIGSSNVYSMVSATFDALSKLKSPRYIANKRGKLLNEVSTAPYKKNLA